MKTKIEEDELKNPNADNDDEDEEENEKTCLHKNEGVTGAVGFLRLIYYASILGGRMDPQAQIDREREMERQEIKFFEDTVALEESSGENSLFMEGSSPLTAHRTGDPLEELLNTRAIDCREPKIPLEQFVNELANEHIDIQHDYVEYAQLVQYLETAATTVHPPKNKKHFFSYLAHPFFLVLGKKNLGLYYDNKIKMMRERRNNIMMSLIEGRMPTPYFKIRLTRQNLLFDALSLIEIQEQENPATLRKQLFVEFENEQGIDQGGISKEFFQLAIDELLNRGYS
jgi:ubiquitin-protein ligase E3 A